MSMLLSIVGASVLVTILVIGWWRFYSRTFKPGWAEAVTGLTGISFMLILLTIQINALPTPLRNVTAALIILSASLIAGAGWEKTL